MSNAQTAADKAAEAVSNEASGSLRPLIQADIADARRLDNATHALAAKLDEAGDQLAQLEIEQLYQDTRKVLDKAKLGKIDAIIGQKRKLDIQVQDLAAGRFPEELHRAPVEREHDRRRRGVLAVPGRVLGRRIRGFR